MKFEICLKISKNFKKTFKRDFALCGHKVRVLCFICKMSQGPKIYNGTKKHLDTFGHLHHTFEDVWISMHLDTKTNDAWAVE